MLTIIFATSLTVAALVMQSQIRDITKLTDHNRRLVISSRERCPTVLSNRHCDFQILAKRADTWDICDNTKPPSGANLPMRRWFLMRASCHLSYAGIKYSLAIPDQKILRW